MSQGGEGSSQVPMGFSSVYTKNRTNRLVLGSPKKVHVRIEKPGFYLSEVYFHRIFSIGFF